VKCIYMHKHVQKKRQVKLYRRGSNLTKREKRTSEAIVSAS
jgi:hypothetical protein